MNLTIALINLKGGVGKTTSAIALATAATRDGHPAVVLDTDRVGTAAFWAEKAERINDKLPFEVRDANIGALRNLKYKDNEVFIIDCPSFGKVLDEAATIADFVVVPTSPRSADIDKAVQVVGSLERYGKPHAVLLTLVQPGSSTAQRGREDLDCNGIPRFETEISLREDLGEFFGNAFGEELFGYEKVWDEIKLECGMAGKEDSDSDDSVQRLARITFSTTAEVQEKVANLAHDRRMSRSQFIEECIVAYLASQQAKRKDINL